MLQLGSRRFAGQPDAEPFGLASLHHSTHQHARACARRQRASNNVFLHQLNLCPFSLEGQHVSRHQAVACHGIMLAVSHPQPQFCHMPFRQTDAGKHIDNTHVL
jgi:hypothetical protein